MTDTFQEYPMMMTHPHYQPPKSVKQADGSVLGEPTRMPPVAATSETEREYYEAQGYEARGKGDPGTWAALKAKAAVDNGGEPYVHQEYPKWVGGKIVNDAEEEAAARQALAEPIKVAEPAIEIGSKGEPGPNVQALLDRIAELEALKDKRTATKARKAA